jgi:hypothetical protein
LGALVSELTECNSCTLDRLLDKYGKQNVKLVADGDWVAVMVFEGDSPITEIDYSRRYRWRQVASFMALTFVCVC